MLRVVATLSWGSRKVDITAVPFHAIGRLTDMCFLETDGGTWKVGYVDNGKPMRGRGCLSKTSGD